LLATTLSTHLKHWTKRLETCSDSPRLDAEILLKHVSGLSDVQLIIRDDWPLDDDTIKRVNTLVASREQGSPIAYLTGWREFYGLNLAINSNVLIPRPETELLVDIALKLIQPLVNPQILDLGTGSGAIALAIASNAKAAQLTATDFDTKALRLARQNATLHNIHNVTFLHSDWHANLEEAQFNLIVSNPPYIDPEDPHLMQGDVRFEPKHALISAQQGYADIHKIIDLASTHLKPGGWIALEHGYNQARGTRDMLKLQGFTDSQTLKDLNQLDRVTLGRWSTG
jgi:release factor glutamine methyltransferase